MVDYESPPALTPHNQPVGLQLVERLADGAGADGQLACQVEFVGQSGARFPFAPRDPPRQQIANLKVKWPPCEVGRICHAVVSLKDGAPEAPQAPMMFHHPDADAAAGWSHVSRSGCIGDIPSGG